jgi:hypothetical protein
MGKKVFTNIVWMLTTGISCALGAAVYYLICNDDDKCDKIILFGIERSFLC